MGNGRRNFHGSPSARPRPPQGSCARFVVTLRLAGHFEGERGLGRVNVFLSTKGVSEVLFRPQRIVLFSSSSHRGRWCLAETGQEWGCRPIAR